MADKKNPDNSSTYAPDNHDRALMREAQRDLAQFHVPVMVHARNSHERLYIAAFDGTGNDRNNPAMGPKTNVALIYEQVELLKVDGNKQIGGGYVAGPGTQEGWFAQKMDLKNGHTYDARLEEMYYQFVKQAEKWIKQDPKVEIRIADLGFSRGAEQTAGFSRLVHERGIQNPADMKVTRDDDGFITRLEPTRAPLVAPGKTAQALALFDPVGTGTPHERDRRAPPSVISGFQIKAEDEARDQFPASHLLDKGRTHGDRFQRVLMPGAHSNIGGGYHLDGLSRHSGNLMIDYLNGLSDKPFLQKMPLRPDLEVIHRSEEHEFFYTTRTMQARTRNGFGESENRSFVESIGGDIKDKASRAMDAAPRDELLNAQFPRQKVPIGPVPPGRGGPGRHDERPLDIDPALPKQGKPAPEPKSSLDSAIDRLSQGAAEKDDRMMNLATADYMRGPLGQQFARDVVQEQQQMLAREHQQQAAVDAQQQVLAQQGMRNPHVMRI